MAQDPENLHAPTRINSCVMPIIYGIAFSCIFPSLVEARTGAAPGLVINSDVAKEIGHGLAIVDSSDGFRENQTDIHSLYLGALQLLYLVRNCVGYYHLWSARKKRPLAVPLIHSFSLKSYPRLTPRVVLPAVSQFRGRNTCMLEKKTEINDLLHVTVNLLKGLA